MSSLKSFEDAGYPTIAILCYAATLIFVFLANRGKLNFSSGKNGGMPVVTMGIFLLFGALFLTFGPGGMRKLSIHLFVLGLSAIMGVATGATYFTVFFVFFGTITFLAMIGSANFLGYTSLLHHVSELECNSYFNAVDLNLCKDDGYLQFLRVVSAFTYFVLAATIVLIVTSTPLLSVLDVERGNDSNGQQQQQQHGAGYNQPYNSGGYNAGYNAPQAGYYQPNQSVPAAGAQAAEGTAAY